MIKSYLFVAFLSMILGAILGSVFTNYTNFKSYENILESYDYYNRDCEILLDSISVWDESFYDTTVETDVYQNYLDSRDNLNCLIWGK